MPQSARRRQPKPPSRSPRRKGQTGWTYGNQEEISDGPWHYQGSTKSPRRNTYKSPARPTKQSKPKQNPGRRVPPAEPQWEPDRPSKDESTASSTTVSAAEMHLKEILNAVSQMDQPLTADVQKAISNAQKLAAIDPAKQLQSAASRLRSAREQLAKARAARQTMHESWAKFISEAVVRWNKHIEDFEVKDAEHLAAIQTVMEKYQSAKNEVEASKEAVAASDLTTEDSIEVNDDELMADNTPGIQDDLRSMVNTLERIRERQSELTDDKLAKKPRIEKSDEKDVEIIGSQSMQPFGKGGKQT